MTKSPEGLTLPALSELRHLSAWSQEQSAVSWARHVLAEAQELVEACESEDPDFTHINEEVGDVFSNLLGFMNHLEFATDYEFNASTAVQSAIDKMIRRRPWIVLPKSQWPKTAQEEDDIWYAQKAEEGGNGKK